MKKYLLIDGKFANYEDFRIFIEYDRYNAVELWKNKNSLS